MKRTSTDKTINIPAMCVHHSPKSKSMGYIAHHDWMEEQIKKGKRQKKCRKCKRYFFAEEMGTNEKQMIQDSKTI